MIKNGLNDLAIKIQVASFLSDYFLWSPENLHGCLGFLGSRFGKHFARQLECYKLHHSALEAMSGICSM
jgi:hypothetical protein